MEADGWYFAFEFNAPRLPSATSDVLRCCNAGMTLAATGKPVLHAYAGPLGLLSRGFGATGVGVGHSQNLWQFTRAIWEAPGAQGGGGDAPARFFSARLWGTIIHPDETAQLPAAIRGSVLTPSPYTMPWDRWQANKHLVHVIGTKVSELCGLASIQDAARAAEAVLDNAVSTHHQIALAGIRLRDDTAAYRAAWRDAVQQLGIQRAEDYDFLSLL